MASFVSSLFSRTPKPVSLRATNNLDMSGAREEGAQGDVGDLVVTGAEQPESPYRTDGSALENTVQTAGGEEELRADQDEKHEPEQELEEVEEGKEAKDDAQSFQQPHSEDEHSDHGGRRKTRQRRNVVHDSASPQEQALESSSSDSSEGEEADWHGESDGGAEVEAEAQDSSRCIFCGEDEEHDPSEDFEECLACASCGDNAHRQCARDAKMLLTEEGTAIYPALGDVLLRIQVAPDDWRCPSCVENDIQPAKPEVVAAARRRSSVPKIARDLLPPQKGVIKPGSHSVFNKLILDDDPMDGSRALRKRKASDDNTEAHIADSPSKQKKYQGRDKTITSLSRSKPPILLESDVDPPASPKTRTRLRQPARVMKSLVRVVEDSSEKFIIAFRVRAGMIADLEHEKRKQKRRERDRARRALKAQHEEEVPVMQYQHYPAIPATTFSAPFYSLQDRDVDETKTKPYGGILTEAEADTTRTFPQPADRKKFDDARLKAEEAWRSRMEAAYANENQKSTHKQSGPPSKIKCINFGGYEIDTWHAAPYPEEYSRNRVLYICEFCLKYMNSDYVAWRHKLKCPAKHPPGDEIYRDGSFSFFEVDGRKNPVYCQNLCLLAKLFLGSKTLYYDVEPFLFYVMTENDEYGCHFVGYFSKEKRPSSLNNVSCILVLPIHQRRGFGHFLIEFSYLLTRNEKKTGSPEKPLSDMGLVSYRSYWRLTMCIQLLNQKDDISITDISDRTGMTADDIVCALEGLRALVRDPVTKTYAMRLDYVYFQQYIENHNKKNYTKINPDALIWTPYIMGRDTSLYDNGAGPQIHTMVQRDEEGDLAEPEEGVQLAVQDDLAEFDKNAYLSNTNLQSLEYLQLNGNSQDSNQTPVPYAPMTSRTESFTSPTKSVRSRAGASDSSRKQQLVPIPPTRFEVFPPLPGTTAKRKPGRPFGSYRSARGGRRGTPVRRSLFRENSVSLSGRPSSLRKTRSQLADMETIDGEEEDEANGNENDIHDDDDEDDDDEEEEEDDEEEEEEEERTDGDLDGTQEGAMHSTEYHDDNAGDMVVVGGADDN